MFLFLFFKYIFKDTYTTIGGLLLVAILCVKISHKTVTLMVTFVGKVLRQCFTYEHTQLQNVSVRATGKQVEL